MAKCRSCRIAERWQNGYCIDCFVKVIGKLRNEGFKYKDIARRIF